MSLRILGALVGIILCTLPSKAWFFQPPPDSVSQETLASFEEASVTALFGLQSIYAMLLQIEQSRTSVNNVEATSAAFESLFTAGEIFSDLSTEELQALEVPIQAVGQIDEQAVNLVVNAGIETPADLARYSSEQILVIRNLLKALQDQNFGPDIAADAESRTTVNNLVWNVASMMVIVNSVSGALALAAQ
ncbi:MAG: hypothetical protein AAF724_20305 [Pseudomonadota bacterium]